jgi:hypothetical protein
VKSNPLSCILALVACVVLSVATPRAHAQTAPAGNSHPTPQDLTDPGVDATRINPFGEIDQSAPVATDAAKVEFAKQVDLSPLRDIAVFHSGRVKIMGHAGA